MFLALLFFCCVRAGVLEEGGYEIVEFHPEEQSVKMYSQVRAVRSLLSTEFKNPKDVDSWLSLFHEQSSFLLRKDGDLVAHAFLLRRSYFGVQRATDGMAVRVPEKLYNAIEVYSFIVGSKHRGTGIAGVFLEAAISRMQKRFSLGSDTLIGLHLNPQDRMMAFSFALYLKYGFCRSTLCKMGPQEIEFFGDRICTLRHPLEVAYDAITGKAAGTFIAMYVKIKHFRKRDARIRMEEVIKVGKALQTALGRNM